MLHRIDISDDGARFRLRTATEEDLPNIAQLDREVFADAAYPFFVLRQLFDVGFAPIVVEDSGQICAYALYSASEARGWVLTLAVVRPARGRGLGRLLMREVLRCLRHRQVRQVLLTVEPTNTTAIDLYSSLGFTCGEAAHTDYFGPGEDRLIMTLPL
ncbi:GNAT family N-acetyltransferase [Streptomyces sp. NPDC008137]|uniref:GNAT family N-acetyltransferase n=1 Tax=Streptomyces sp. NPDC008137 TaxID=3364813 RepID=UPI0036F11AE3